MKKLKHKRVVMALYVGGGLLLVCFFISIIISNVTDHTLPKDDAYFYSLAATTTQDYQAQVKILGLPMTETLQKSCFWGVGEGPGPSSKVYECRVATSSSINRVSQPNDTQIIQRQLIPLLQSEGFEINNPMQLAGPTDYGYKVLLWATTNDSAMEQVCNLQVEYATATNQLSYNLFCQAEAKDTPHGFSYDPTIQLL